ncbi:Clustered mitochondria protein [Cyberlindnera fabianii]|uniref:Clustered mitochondria protein n=1 Tax=Cyberlindnera fabianii TaxID=36022 RepID=A0A1V2LBP0_CYBFA|nr:Clustered mitochondria protein [Cyberlindnera fabianii]
MSQFDQINSDAERLISQSQYEQALAATEQCIAQGGISARTLINRAVALANLGDPQQAIADLHEALRLNPTDDQSKRIDQLIDQLTDHAAQVVKDAPQQDGQTGTRSIGGDGETGSRDLASTLVSGLMSSGMGGGYNQSQQGSKLGMLMKLFGSIV